jgi:hypothetical protein
MDIDPPQYAEENEKEIFSCALLLASLYESSARVSWLLFWLFGYNGGHVLNRVIQFYALVIEEALEGCKDMCSRTDCFFCVELNDYVTLQWSQAGLSNVFQVFSFKVDRQFHN